ncbi:hypothetical protein [Vibrio sp. OPT18]|uniref:hypothetical protein n=1 Tax=Vibrio sp. OPT18 TaxID=2778641 RepID=UPI001880A8A5|nr:hypothetical protein [Vibrio sp. OPT18]MBE8578718.1 hypothetical protein [Vibrio sp. OPT18]
MDKQQLIKLHKADFTQAYLAVQNSLGGNPLTLLMSEGSVAAIEQAIDNLEAMLFIASSCHAKALDEKQTEEFSSGETSESTTTDSPGLTTEKKKAKEKPVKQEASPE